MGKGSAAGRAGASTLALSGTDAFGFDPRQRFVPGLAVVGRAIGLPLERRRRDLIESRAREKGLPVGVGAAARAHHLAALPFGRAGAEASAVDVEPGDAPSPRRRIEHADRVSE